MTAIKTEDVIGTLHVICADPKLLEHHLKAVEAGGRLEVDASKLICTHYNQQGG
jgi:hypothetical protein